MEKSIKRLKTLINIYKPKYYDIEVLKDCCIIVLNFNNFYDNMYGDSISFDDSIEICIKKSMIKDFKKISKKLYNL